MWGLESGAPLARDQKSVIATVAGEECRPVRGEPAARAIADPLTALFAEPAPEGVETRMTAGDRLQRETLLPSAQRDCKPSSSSLSSISEAIEPGMVMFFMKEILPASSKYIFMRYIASTIRMATPSSVDVATISRG